MLRTLLKLLSSIIRRDKGSPLQQRLLGLHIANVTPSSVGSRNSARLGRGRR